MSDKVFLDSNILVYSYSNSEIPKQEIARKLITESNSIISTQVLQELGNTVIRKFKFTHQQTEVAVKECCQNSNLHINTEETIISALEIASKYGFSFYDCIIISAALESNCTILYSEDLQDNQLIEDKLTIRNPFKSIDL